MCRDRCTMQMHGFEQSNVTSLAKIESDIATVDKPNLVPRVFRLFGQRGNAGKTLGTSKKFNFFDWLFRNGFHCFTAEILR